jgi:hypothetical protein
VSWFERWSLIEVLIRKVVAHRGGCLERYGWLERFSFIEVLIREALVHRGID